MKTKVQASATPATAVPKAPRAMPAKAVRAASKAAPTPVPSPSAKPAVKPASTSKPASKPAAPAKAATPARVEAPVLGKQKHKLVRDSFTIPKDEYGVLVGLKQRAGALAHHAKKSEILRAGVQLLSALPDAGFLAALKAVPSLKTGRPKQEPVAPVAAVAQGGKKQGR